MYIDVIAYHLVHFVSIRLINKCQLGIDFIFTSERRARNILRFYENIGAQSSISRKKHYDESETLQSIHDRMSTRG